MSLTLRQSRRGLKDLSMMIRTHVLAASAAIGSLAAPAAAQY
jgi:hypothetical protein